jgi:hypothetical protein
MWHKYCEHKYVNGKMILVETIPGKWRGAMKKNSGGITFKYYRFNIL